MRQALVTGGNGFIGQHLVTSLVAHGRRMRVLAPQSDRSGYGQCNRTLAGARQDHCDVAHRNVKKAEAIDYHQSAALADEACLSIGLGHTLGAAAKYP
jgi:nucleoside-diphosphate-sugar epimerase